MTVIVSPEDPAVIVSPEDPASVRAVTFDAGQTLVELDTDMLAARLEERGVVVAPEALGRAWPVAWQRHEQAVAAGAHHPWKQLMVALLDEAGVAADAIAPAVDWLWAQQPTRNLWRRPVAGMRALVEDLHRAGVPMAVVSNSEGALAELLDELGWARWFVAIADSGRLGVAKPAAGIFEWAVQRLGVPASAIVHVGDSRAADVDGALAAGLQAVWFGPLAQALRLEDSLGASGSFIACRDAVELRAALARWGLAVQCP